MHMEFKVMQDNYNALLKRKEVLIEVDHEESGTPSRIELKKAVAAKYGTKPDNVYVVDVETKTGTQNAICELQVYDDPKVAANIVPKYIQVRDLPPEEQKKRLESKRPRRRKRNRRKRKLRSRKGRKRSPSKRRKNNRRPQRRVRRARLSERQEGSESKGGYVV